MMATRSRTSQAAKTRPKVESPGEQRTPSLSGSTPRAASWRWARVEPMASKSSKPLPPMRVQTAAMAGTGALRWYRPWPRRVSRRARARPAEEPTGALARGPAGPWVAGHDVEGGAGEEEECDGLVGIDGADDAGEEVGFRGWLCGGDDRVIVRDAWALASVVSHKWLVFRREGFSCPTRRE